MYTTPNCIYCKTLKEFLKKNNIQFEEVDVAKNLEARNEMVAKSGQLGVPVSDIDGQIVVGFDRAKISELLNIKE